MENYELYHAGVKGMKWGVRKARRQEKRELKRQVRARRYKNEYANRGKSFVERSMRGAFSGMLSTAVILSHKRQTGEGAVKKLIAGTIGGAAIGGAIGGAVSVAYSNKGKKLLNK